MINFAELTREDCELLANSCFADMRAADIPEDWRAQLMRFASVNAVWAQRACWICGRFGPCKHREPEADAARLDANGRNRYRAHPDVLVAEEERLGAKR